MLTKGAIGNLVNRYKAVLAKCNLINTFGSLAVASMLVLGGAGVASAEAHSPKNLAATNEQHILLKDKSIINIDTNIYNAAVEAYSYSNNFSDKGSFLEIVNADEFSVTHNYDGEYCIKVHSRDRWLTENDRSRLDISANKNINITASKNGLALYSRSGIINLKSPQIRIKSHKEGASDISKLIVIRNNSDVTLDASDIVEISAGKNQYAIDIAHENCTLNIFGNTTIKAEDTKVAIFTRNGATTNIGQSSHAVKIDGDVVFNYNHNDAGKPANSTVNITLTGSNSHWNGSPCLGLFWWKDNKPTEDLLKITGMNLTLKNGGTWTPATTEIINVADKYDSLENNKIYTIALSNLHIDGGIIKINDGISTTVENIAGEGKVYIEKAKSGEVRFKANNPAKGSKLIVYGMKDGVVQTAGDFEKAEDVIPIWESAKDGAETVIAEAPEDKVAGKITVKSADNVSQARNTLMDSLLQQASVTTVALDKILTNDVRKRLGDIRSDRNQAGVWMRWDGGKLKGDAGVTNDFNTIQIGGDTKVGTNCRIGVAGSFTHGDAEFARGNSEFEGFSFALYSTWMGENGMFADIVTRLGHFSDEMSVEGTKGDIDNRVFSLSGEYGWRFDLCKQFFLEPQVELAYTYVSFDDLQLGTAHYEFDSVNSLTGRAGLVAGWKLPNERGNLYVRASVVQQFMGDAKITGMDGNAFNVQELDGNDTWMEYGIGTNIRLTDNTYIWADVEHTEGAEIEEEWRGTVGIRYSF